MRYAVLGTLTLLVLPTSAFAQEALAAGLHEVPSPYDYPAPAWSPYLVGALIGLLTIATLTISKKPVGASSAYADAVGLLGRLVAPRHVASLKHFQDHKPAIGWSLLFVLGAVGGSFLAAWSGGELTGDYLQDLWVARFGPDSYLLRTLVALAGGAIMAFGARLAGGCTSGHGISGTMQLAVGSWIAVICFFVSGIATALIVYRL